MAGSLVLHVGCYLLCNHVYLNEADERNPIVDGATTFYDDVHQGEEREVRIQPKFGRVLMFQHRDLLHPGQELGKGVNLTLRTDLLFRKREEMLPERSRT